MCERKKERKKERTLRKNKRNERIFLLLLCRKIIIARLPHEYNSSWVTARPLSRARSPRTSGRPPPPPFFLFAFFFVFISSMPSSSSLFFFFFFFFFCSHLNELSSSLIIIIEQFFGVHPRRTANRGGTANAREARSEEEEEDEDSGPLSKEGVLSAKIIGALPLEKVEGKSALLKRWSVKELAREVKANHASKCPHSTRQFTHTHTPLEKEELVEVVLSLRGDPMCSVCFSQFVSLSLCLSLSLRYLSLSSISLSRHTHVFGVQCVDTRRTRDECVFLAFFLFVFTQST